MTYPSNFTLPSGVLKAATQGGMGALPELTYFTENYLHNRDNMLVWIIT